MLDQHADQRFVEPGFLLNGTQIEGKGDSTKLLRSLGCFELMS